MPALSPVDVGAGALTLSGRPSLFGKAETYALSAHELRGGDVSVPFAEIVSVRVYSVPGMAGLTGPVALPQQFCLVRSRSGTALRLHSVAGSGDGSFAQFVAALIARTRAANPAVAVWQGMPPLLYWSWMMTFGILTAAVALCVIFGTTGLAIQHELDWESAGFVLVVAGLGYMPATFLRATWRRRSRPYGFLESNGER